eukprot:scaffold64230_cov41-Attheya_sp.AAC.1
MMTTRRTAVSGKGRKTMTKGESRREAKRVAYEASLAASDSDDEEEIDVVNDENAIAPAGLNEDHPTTVSRCSYAAISKCIFATFAVAPPLDSCGRCSAGLHHACQTEYFSSENIPESDGCMKRCFECVCPSTTTGASEKKETVTIFEGAVDERRMEKSNGHTDDTLVVGTILEDNEYTDPLNEEDYTLLETPSGAFDPTTDILDKKDKFKIASYQTTLILQAYLIVLQLPPARIPDICIMILDNFTKIVKEFQVTDCLKAHIQRSMASPKGLLSGSSLLERAKKIRTYVTNRMIPNFKVGSGENDEDGYERVRQQCYLEQWRETERCRKQREEKKGLAVGTRDVPRCPADFRSTYEHAFRKFRLNRLICAGIGGKSPVKSASHASAGKDHVLSRTEARATKFATRYQSKMDLLTSVAGDVSTAGSGSTNTTSASAMHFSMLRDELAFKKEQFEEQKALRKIENRAKQVEVATKELSIIEKAKSLGAHVPVDVVTRILGNLFDAPSQSNIPASNQDE